MFRLVNNLPAAKCGKINIGDKILAVRGREAEVIVLYFYRLTVLILVT